LLDGARAVIVGWSQAFCVLRWLWIY